MPKLRTLLVVAATVGVAIAAPSAMAAIDIETATSVVSADGTAVITKVGGVMLGLAALAVVFKWAKAAFFG